MPEKVYKLEHFAAGEQAHSFIDLKESSPIQQIHFSPYEWSQDLILIALKKLVIIGQINCESNITLKKIWEVEIKSGENCNSLCLSPDTSINVVPMHIRFCTSTAESCKILVYDCSNGEHEVQELEGHRKFINSLSYDPENKFISSASDDNTAKLWSIADGCKCTATFILTSPGMGTCWHREEPSKLLVAEKCGLIRFYNVATLKPIMSVDLQKSLYDVHWSPVDSQIVAALQMGELVLWDVTKSSTPKQILLFTHHGGSLRFSPLGELVASVNRLDGSLKVIHVLTQQQRLHVPVQLPSNVTWHQRLPIVCLGVDSKLCFWRVKSK